MKSIKNIPIIAPPSKRIKVLVIIIHFPLYMIKIVALYKILLNKIFNHLKIHNKFKFSKLYIKLYK